MEKEADSWSYFLFVAVDCGDPNVQANLKTSSSSSSGATAWNNWKFVPLTGSTLYGSFARLKCPEGEEIVGQLPANIRCKEDGTWSKPKAKCATLGKRLIDKISRDNS